MLVVDQVKKLLPDGKKVIFANEMTGIVLHDVEFVNAEADDIISIDRTNVCVSLSEYDTDLRHREDHDLDIIATLKGEVI